MSSNCCNNTFFTQLNKGDRLGWVTFKPFQNFLFSQLSWIGLDLKVSRDFSPQSDNTNIWQDLYEGECQCIVRPQPPVLRIKIILTVTLSIQPKWQTPCGWHHWHRWWPLQYPGPGGRHDGHWPGPVHRGRGLGGPHAGHLRHLRVRDHHLPGQQYHHHQESLWSNVLMFQVVIIVRSYRSSPSRRHLFLSQVLLLGDYPWRESASDILKF